MASQRRGQARPGSSGAGSCTESPLHPPYPDHRDRQLPPVLTNNRGNCGHTEPPCKYISDPLSEGVSQRGNQGARVGLRSLTAVLPAWSSASSSARGHPAVPLLKVLVPLPPTALPTIPLKSRHSSHLFPAPPPSPQSHLLWSEMMCPALSILVWKPNPQGDGIRWWGLGTGGGW